MKYLITPILTLLLLSCASDTDKYKDYSKPLVIATVEYNGEHDSLSCNGDFRCEKGALECVYFYHKNATNRIGQAKELLQTGKEEKVAIIEFYNALCSLYQAKQYMGVLKRESPQDYDMLEERGLVQQTDWVANILVIKIRELENQQSP
tara:strand:+ start:344 stop:790 length:447 start_codon:yes stop_codon:yes gene_type:complete